MEERTRTAIDELSSAFRIDTCNEVATKIYDILTENRVHVIEFEYIRSVVKRMMSMSYGECDDEQNN